MVEASFGLDPPLVVEVESKEELLLKQAIEHVLDETVTA